MICKDFDMGLHRYIPVYIGSVRIFLRTVLRTELNTHDQMLFWSSIICAWLLKILADLDGVTVFKLYLLRNMFIDIPEIVQQA